MLVTIKIKDNYILLKNKNLPNWTVSETLMDIYNKTSSESTYIYGKNLILDIETFEKVVENFRRDFEYLVGEFELECLLARVRKINSKK